MVDWPHKFTSKGWWKACIGNLLEPVALFFIWGGQCLMKPTQAGSEPWPVDAFSQWNEAVEEAAGGRLLLQQPWQHAMVLGVLSLYTCKVSVLWASD
jgi:hypothetical protein